MTDAREIIAHARHSQACDGGYSIVGGPAADAAIYALHAAGFRILGPDEVTALQRALARAEDGAGTLPAKQSVKLRPADWHAVGDFIRALGRKA